MAEDNPHGLDAFELSHRANAGDCDYGAEAVIVAQHNRFQMRTPAYPADCDYVRVCDPDGGEIAYWNTDEIKADPADVIGAIMGALVRRDVATA